VLLDNSASFTSKGEKLVSNIENKTIFRDSYRPSVTGIVECSEIVDVGCDLKQFDDLN